MRSCVLALSLVTALAASNIVHPLAFVNGTVRPGECSLSALFAILELTYILVSVGVCIDALSGTFAIFIISLITVTAVEMINALAMLHIGLPFANVSIAIGIIESTLALT